MKLVHMTVLVTGGNGFIGSHVVRALISAGHSARVLVLPGTNLRALENVKAEVFWGDLNVPESLSAAARGAHAICHLAAKVGDFGPAHEFFKVNVIGTKNLLDAAIRSGVQRIVFVSTLAVHRLPKEGIINGDEDYPTDNTQMPYALSKIIGEQEILKAHAQGLIEGVIVRPGLFPFGPFDLTSFVPLARNLHRYWHIDGGKAVFCSAYVENLAHGIVLATEKSIASGRVYVIADSERPTWQYFMDVLCDLLGRKKIRRTLPFWVAHSMATACEAWAAATGFQPAITRYRVKVAARNCWFSSARAAADLGYCQLFSLEEGLRRTVTWFLKSGTGPLLS